MVTRNQIAIVGVCLTALALFWTVQYTQASIDYWMSEKETFSEGLNSVTINCKNGGQMDGDFYLVVTFVNVSFSESTKLPYTVVDNSTVKFSYTLHADESGSKAVFFDVDENVESFSLHISIEPQSWIIKTNRVYAQNLAYKKGEYNLFRLV